MAEPAQTREELAVPDGGIGNFIMDDAEIEAAYGSDDGIDKYGDEGIAQFPELTRKMAAMGREGDDVLAHLQTGELVIPAPLLDKNPDMRDTIFAFLEGQGIEDPRRYLVGSGANSINPDTGAYEFFLGKIFSAIGNVVKGAVKAVTGAVKSVVKVVKKVAPIVLPVLGSMVLGPVYGAALGSGIATLINGGSASDALKSALVSGVTGGVMSGVSGAISGAGFGSGVKAALNPANIGAGLSAVKTGFTEGFGQSGIGFDSMRYGIAGGEQINAALAEQAAQAAAAGAVPGTGTPAVSPEQAASAAAVPGATNAPALTTESAARSAITGPMGAPVTPEQALTQAQTYQPPGFVQSIKGAFTPGDDIGFGEGLKNAFFPGSPTTVQTTQLGDATYRQAFNNAMSLPGMTPELAAERAIKAAEAATASAGPGLLRTYGPLAATGLAATAAMGGFSPVPAEPLDIAMRDEQGNVVTGEDLVEQAPGEYLVGDLGDMVLDPETGRYVPRSSYSVGQLEDLTIRAPTYSTYMAPTQYALTGGSNYLLGSPAGGPFERPYVTAADGGAIFPRRNGGIMPDEGIPDQDSVRAMLMPGEFVMTTDAVRGLGNGNLNNGIKNMYSVMRNLEARGRAMA